MNTPDNTNHFTPKLALTRDEAAKAIGQSAVTVKENICFGGSPMFDVWARGKNRRTVQWVRREIARRRPEMFFIE